MDVSAAKGGDGAIYVGLINANPNQSANVEVARCAGGKRHCGAGAHRSEDGLPQRVRHGGAGAANAVQRRPVDRRQVARELPAKSVVVLTVK